MKLVLLISRILYGLFLLHGIHSIANILHFPHRTALFVESITLY